jgi:hypothetical protein
MNTENNQPSYLEMAVRGFARAVVPFPIEHPLERMKLESQAHPEKTTEQAVKHLWRSQGFKGLYAGSRATFLRRTIRETYHWPVMLLINRFWKHIIPEKINKDNLATNIVTGNSMALVQACVTLPFERLLIEKTTKEGYLPFLKKMKDTKRLIVYEGFQATLIRHSIVWNLFFIASHVSTTFLKKINPKNSYPILSYVGQTVFISTFVVGVGYPLEYLRNRILMEPEILVNGTLKGYTSLFHRYKWAMLYRGAPVMLVHNFIQTLIIQKLIDRINSK